MVSTQRQEKIAEALQLATERGQAQANVGNVYYIATTGSDETGDGSIGNPWASADEASKHLVAGDTVYYRSGTYTNASYVEAGARDLSHEGDYIWKSGVEAALRINDLHGDEDAWITFAAYPGEAVTLKFDGLSGVRISNSSYVRVEGFEIEGIVADEAFADAKAAQFIYRLPDGSLHEWPLDENGIPLEIDTPLGELGAEKPGFWNGNGININSGTHHIEIIDNDIHDIPGSGISGLGGSDYLTIVGNHIARVTWYQSNGGHAITFKNLDSIDESGKYKILVVDNEIEDVYNRLVSWSLKKTAVSVALDEGKGIHFQSNTRAEDWTHGEILVANNLIVRQGQAGLTANGADGITWFANTLVDNGYIRTAVELGLTDPIVTEESNPSAGIRLQGGDELRAYNNLIVSTQASSIEGFSPSDSAVESNLDAQGNLLVNASLGNRALDKVEWVAGFAIAASNDAGFVDAEAGDYRLSASSIARNAGVEVESIFLDADGNDRDDGALDVGAFEVQSRAPQIWWVATDGDDANAGTEDAPFATVKEANKHVQAGDTVYLKAGTYTNAAYGDGDIWKSGTIFSINGVHGNAIDGYVTYAAAPGDHVKLQFDTFTGVRITDSSYIRLQGFEIEGYGANITLDEARAAQFLYRFEGDETIYTRDPDELLDAPLSTLGKVQKPNLYNGNAIALGSGTNHIEILDNSIHDVPGKALSANSGSDYVTFDGNTVTRTTLYSSSGTHAISFQNLESIDDYDGYKIFITNNQIYDNYNLLVSWVATKTLVTKHIDEGKPIHIEDVNPDTGWTHGRILIANNLAVRSGNAAVVIARSERADVINNTLVDGAYINTLMAQGSADPLVVEGYKVSGSALRITDSDDIVVRNNLISQDQDDVALLSADADADTGNILFEGNLYAGGTGLNGRFAAFASGVHEIAEAGFVDAAAGDYRLAAGSAARNAGVADADITTDLDGNDRDDGFLDVGAFEVLDAGNAPPVFTSADTIAVAERETDTGHVVAAFDPEGEAVSFAITGGADAALFTLDASGALRFLAAPDFEAPQDGDGDNLYALEITATDASGEATVQALGVQVTDVDESVFYAFNDTQGTRFETLADAVSAAAAGDHLSVDAEGYSLRESLVIRTDALTLHLDKPDKVTAITIATGATSFTHEGDANMFVRAANGDKTIVTGAGNDTLIGTNGLNRLIANEGRDRLEGGKDGILDLYEGGIGNDTYLLSDGEGSDQIIDIGGLSDIVQVQDEIGTVFDMRADLMIERVIGSDGGADLMTAANASALVSYYGRGGDDDLSGSRHNDLLNGGDGADLLDGGLGSDRLVGGSGADLFQFSDIGFGSDRIFGFEDGIDKISFAMDGAVSFDDLTITDRGGPHWWIYVDTGEASAPSVIRLLGSAHTVTLSEEDFLFN
ncbi:MAG: right-handed parallel beta-helix repeat-containing protein [Neomegalonema sp.]|nr:right-handed parallel beta-helix repeat-containing protein [Neomegalonema sp.]